jgi:hypothetical protein
MGNCDCPLNLKLAFWMAHQRAQQYVWGGADCSPSFSENHLKLPALEKVLTIYSLPYDPWFHSILTIQ